MSHILWFDEIDRQALNQAGGKGANLGEMTLAGLPVPPGFVVAAGAYQAHLETAGLPQRIRARLEGLPADDVTAWEAAAAEIQGWICAAPVPPYIDEAIRIAYMALSARIPSGPATPPVAVRSSATAEDLPDASFAGQQETYLNIAGPAAVVDAVRLCWASLWGARAIAYRMRMGYDHFHVSLAAVVQAMVPSEVSGVMFTANPLTGSREEFLVTASYGLGEAVVSGLVTPDTYSLTPTGRVVQRTLGAKEQQILPAGEGTRTEAVPAADRSRYCLADEDLRALASLGRQVTAHYGAPQDIEWGLADGHLYLLQARPITTLGDSRAADPPLSRKDRIVRSRMAENMMDHFPDPLKPMDYTVALMAVRGIFSLLGSFGLRPGTFTLEERPDGRLIIKPTAPGLRFAMLWRLPAGLIRALRQDPAQDWARVRRAMEADLAAPRQADLAQLDGPGLAAIVAATTAAFHASIAGRFQAIFGPFLLHGALVRFWTRRAVGRKEAGETGRRLYLALPYETALMNRATARLAGVAAKHGLESESFRQALGQFLTEWGDRPTRGMVPVPGYATWKEDQTALLGLVEALRLDPSSLDADGLEARQQAEFAAARDRVAGRLGRLSRRWFAHSLERVRSALVAREESLRFFEATVAYIRRAALHLGARLAKQGLLARPDEVFFLLTEELRPAAAGEIPDLRERVARRMRAYDRVCAAHARGENWLVAAGSAPAPRRSTAHQRPGAHQRSAKSHAAAGRGPRLTGLSASGGQATGPVCIIRGPAEFGKLKKGDILVAPATAPVWTPLFAVAAAVVTDTGGALSHAAIVAREYGIPAVLATGSATTTLRDGQTVTVDGTAGWVRAE